MRWLTGSLPPSGRTRSCAPGRPGYCRRCRTPEQSRALAASAGGLWWRIGGVVRTVRPQQWVKNVLQLVKSRPKSESPTHEMLRDGPFVAIVLSWVVLVMWVVYRLKPG